MTVPLDSELMEVMACQAHRMDARRAGLVKGGSCWECGRLHFESCQGDKALWDSCFCPKGCILVEEEIGMKEETDKEILAEIAMKMPNWKRRMTLIQKGKLHVNPCQTCNRWGDCQVRFVLFTDMGECWSPKGCIAVMQERKA